MINNYSLEDKVLLVVDCIIFGFDEEDLKILLIWRGFELEKGKWFFVGGFLKLEEIFDDVVWWVLEWYMGLSDVYME